MTIQTDPKFVYHSFQLSTERKLILSLANLSLSRAILDDKHNKLKNRERKDVLESNYSKLSIEMRP